MKIEELALKLCIPSIRSNQNIRTRTTTKRCKDDDDLASVAASLSPKASRVEWRAEEKEGVKKILIFFVYFILLLIMILIVSWLCVQRNLLQKIGAMYKRRSNNTHIPTTTQVYTFAIIMAPEEKECVVLSLTKKNFPSKKTKKMWNLRELQHIKVTRVNCIRLCYFASLFSHFLPATFLYILVYIFLFEECTYLRRTQIISITRASSLGKGNSGTPSKAASHQPNFIFIFFHFLFSLFYIYVFLFTNLISCECFLQKNPHE